MTLLNGSLPADIPRRLLHWVLGIIIWLLLARLSSSYFSCQMCNLELSMDFFSSCFLWDNSHGCTYREQGRIISTSMGRYLITKFVCQWLTYIPKGKLRMVTYSTKNKPSYSSVNLSQYSSAWRIGILFVNIKSVYICIHLRGFPKFSPFPFLNTEGDLCLIIK